MKFSEEHPELFSRLKIEFKAAEEQIKDTELRFPAMGLVVPAVNQLRYVAQHLLETSDVHEPAKQVELLHEMISHCKRSIFDAAEVAILGYLGDIKEFVDDFDDVVSVMKKSNGVMNSGFCKNSGHLKPQSFAGY